MANKWKDLRRPLSAEDEVVLKTRVREELGRLPLAELRKARKLTQNRLAELLQVNQGAISKIEKRSDMYLSTLRSYVEAVGGHLDIRAVFPNGEIVLEHLSEEQTSTELASPETRCSSRVNLTRRNATS